MPHVRSVSDGGIGSREEFQPKGGEYVPVRSYITCGFCKREYWFHGSTADLRDDAECPRCGGYFFDYRFSMPTRAIRWRAFLYRTLDRVCWWSRATVELDLWKHKKSSRSAPDYFPTSKVTPHFSRDPRALLQEATAYEQVGNYKRARACASEAIQANPSFIDAYMTRAYASRVLGDLDGAIADYCKVIEVDPENHEAWLFRGACRTQKASAMTRNVRLELMNDAHPDYRRAAELRPDDEQGGLALLELEICIGKYREAIGTTGVWWNRIQSSSSKLICAWLGAIASVLAGRPESRWAHYREFLKQDSTLLGPASWSVAEISNYLRDLEESGYDTKRMAILREIYQLFIAHFAKGGPALK